MSVTKDTTNPIPIVSRKAVNNISKNKIKKIFFVRLSKSDNSLI